MSGRMRSLFFAALTVAVCVAELQAGDRSLTDLFASALVAQEGEYAALRGQIVAEQERALPFLEEQLKDPAWRTRMLAEAMLQWLRKPAANRERESRIEGIIHARMDPPADGYITGEDGLASYIYWSHYGHGNAVDELLGPDSSPFFFELALKGPPSAPKGKYSRSWQRSDAPLRDVEIFESNYARWARCVAMGHLASFQRPEVLPALIGFLQEEPDPRLRRCAAFGLGQTKSKEAVAPLIAALADPDEQVGLSAAGALGEIGDIGSIELVLGQLARGGLQVEYAVRQAVFAIVYQRFKNDANYKSWRTDALEQLRWGDLAAWWAANKEHLLKGELAAPGVTAPEK